MPGTNTIHSKGRAAVVLCIVALFGLAALASVTQAPGGSGEKHCQDFGAGLTEFEVDPIADGEHTDGTLHVTIVFDEDALTFDWTSDIGVDFVFVKGSEDVGSLYVYDPEATSDTGLHAPLKETTPEDGDFYSINHVLFCYDLEGTPSPSPSPTDTETPEPSVSPTDTETPEPSVSPTDTETPEPSVSPTDTETAEPSVSPTDTVSVLPTKVSRPRVLGGNVARTGAGVLELAWAGLLLLALGVTGYVAAVRSDRRA